MNLNKIQQIEARLSKLESQSYESFKKEILDTLEVKYKAHDNKLSNVEEGLSYYISNLLNLIADLKNDHADYQRELKLLCKINLKAEELISDLESLRNQLKN